MLQRDSSSTHGDLARQFTQLNGRWTEVVAQVDSKYKVLMTASQQYEDFKSELRDISCHPSSACWHDGK